MVDVAIISESRYKFDHKRIKVAVQKTVEGQGVTSPVEAAVLVVGERKMRELHLKYMGTDEPTDVLSFPLSDPTDKRLFLDSPEGILRLGDIVICYPVAVKQAGESNRLVDEEMEFLAAHGTLHLLGIHHEE